MIYLIGGSPRTGKTTLARKLAEDLKIPFESTDTLESAVASGVTENELKEFFPKSLMRRETNQSNDEMYEKYSAQEIVDVYLKQAGAVNNAIRNYVLQSVEDYGSCILEGYHITPALAEEYEKQFEVKAIFLGRENIENIVSSIKNGTEENDWVIKKTKNEETFPKIAEMIKLFSLKVENEAGKSNFLYKNVDGDFQMKINESISYLCSN